MSCPRKLDELTNPRRAELIDALRECAQRLQMYPEPNPVEVLERAYEKLDGHPAEFRAWVDGYSEGLRQRLPELIDDTMKSIARVRDGLLHPLSSG